ncbi:MAG TPA: hypothetical protein VMU08_05210 [Rhizomicrobium sp.]|nr:hypothetical protein [Rhizomicrobium sp.]
MDFPHGFLLFLMALAFHNVGVTWFAQIAVYPLFGMVGTSEYVPYHSFYSRHIALPVIVPGFVSFLAPLAFVFIRPESVPAWLALANAACGILSLMVTVGLEIPRHARLRAQGKNVVLIRQLVAYNWPRTFGISASAILTTCMVVGAFTPA